MTIIKIRSPEETEDEDWDEEEVDEELTELREVLEKSRVTVSYLEESGDSLDNEDNEMIKVLAEGVGLDMKIYNSIVLFSCTGQAPCTQRVCEGSPS